LNTDSLVGFLAGWLVGCLSLLADTEAVTIDDSGIVNDGHLRQEQWLINLIANRQTVSKAGDFISTAYHYF